MALTQSDLEALESAIATGELTVEYDGKRVTFRSIDELIKAAEYVRRRVIAAPPRIGRAVMP